MNKKQRESTAKLLYKLVELTYIAVIIANFIPGKEFDKVSLLIGIIIGLIAYLIAFWTEHKEE
ncbi:MAG: hypothetical protein MRJ65_02105 [Candidatus Brocadiaceae bacterium]|nr:hypothetical protein [Candidatus Brocadiaceae bacterium]